MKRITILFVIAVVGTGYLCEQAFRLMNSPSDAAYIGGIALVFAWLFVLFFTYTYAAKVFKQEVKRRRENNEKQSSASSTPVEPTTVNDRMHN